MPLKEYRKKRYSDRTSEPIGKEPEEGKGAGRAIFVVQKHAARRLHYDFRLEMEGVLRSWAVPKGPSLNPRQRRLAVMVEDHPLEYADFEGTIAPGNYGAGAVIVWDRGEYRSMDPPDDPARGVSQGKLDFELFGSKLRGGFTLIRTRAVRAGSGEKKQQWLLIKRRDKEAQDFDVTATCPRSVVSGRTVEQVNSGSSRDPG